ncbi:hypothetical protein QJS10_CPA06g01801 [Acorus calamus]|uniref:ARM repeat superfamily protein n=1 Tax=Acorus calamus TaxID=4465 RepID=A0AAV9EK38_ACOCL|nr:hypothetical protein QJS10_CPA06g01801 [Acorus calamus]
MLLLSSCWKHYVTLLRLDDHRFLQHYSEMLDQFLSALQFYNHNGGGDDLGKANSRTQTKKFFLNCISLLLGRLDGKQLGIAISECGPKLLNLLVLQLQSADEDMIEGSIEVLRLIIFKTNLESGSCLLETQQMESVLPLLLNLLDQRDSAARAVVLLISEYCALDPDGQCTREIFKRLEFGNNHQKRNAIDVVSELIRASSDSGNTLSPSIRKDIAKHLLECLVDEELVNYVQASNMFLLLDPPLVLPALVRLVYSLDKKVGVAASDAIIAILKHHNQNPDVIVLMIDCLSILSHGPGISETCGEMWEAIPRCSVQLKEGSKLDIDQVLRLIPQWSRSVKNWDALIESLINKLFQEPSNATIVQFLSCISEDLAKAGELVLRCVLSHSWEGKEINANWLSCGGVKTPTSSKSAKYEKSLFNRLCPLLIIRLLPLRNFNDLNSPALYGDLPKHVPQVKVDVSTYNQATVSALLINRAFASFEFEDVRKLAAELCGRLHPQVLLPIVDSHLEHAIVCQDILKMKSCLFAVCTSLVIRGRDTALNPVLIRIRKSLETVLLWPSLDADEILKAQHGCIDCLALMICAEVQALESSRDVAVESSVLTYTIQQLSDKTSENAACPLPFRLCMANVLISACQKVSSLGKPSLARRILPALLQSVKVMAESEVRAACLHVLFSAVYHLKSEVLPFTSELLKMSIKALKKGSEKEKIAAAKLMASLMSSEEEIVESISTGLVEAKSVLAKIVAIDSSPELQQLCRKLLLCITSPLEEAFGALTKNEL